MLRYGAEVVEYACNLAPDLMGEYVENVSTGMDTYSIKQPLGVCYFHVGQPVAMLSLACSSTAMACC